MAASRDRQRTRCGRKGRESGAKAPVSVPDAPKRVLRRPLWRAVLLPPGQRPVVGHDALTSISPHSLPVNKITRVTVVAIYEFMTWPLSLTALASRPNPHVGFYPLIRLGLFWRAFLGKLSTGCGP